MKSAFPKILISLLLLMLFISVVTVIALPYGVAYLIKSQVRDLGVENVGIANVDINYFPGRFVLQGFEMQSNDHRKLRIAELDVEFSVNVINKQIILPRVSVKDLSVHIQQTEDGAYTLAAADNPADNDEPSVAGTTDETASTWQIFITEMDLQQLAVIVSSANANDRLEFKLNVSMSDFRAATSGSMEFAQLSIGDFMSQANGEDVLSYELMQVESVEYARNALDIKSIALKNMAAKILRLENGEFHSLSVADNFFSMHPDKAEKNNIESENQLAWSLGAFTIQGDSNVRLVDQTMAGSSDISLMISSFDLGALHSDQARTATEFKLKANTDQYSKIVLQGQVWPLLGAPELKMKSAVEQLDIAPYSAYVRELIGYNIKTGQLNLETELSIKDRQLSSVNQLRVNKFTVAVADEQKAKAFEDDINLSLESALYFIRDDNDDIKLTIPVNGAIDDPDFDLASVIRKAGGKALQGATATYLKFALQPWGALFMIGEKISEKAGQIRFDPVEFSAGEAVLKEQAQPYLLKLSELLKSKTKLRLSLCPLTTQMDVLALQSAGVAQSSMQAALASLAEQRALAVKNHFIQAHGIESGRLFICPASQDSENQIPRVVIEM